MNFVVLLFQNLKRITLILLLIFSQNLYAQTNPSLKFLIWNIQKAQNRNWASSFKKINSSVDFLLIQEATNSPVIKNTISPLFAYSHYYKTWGNEKTSTGLMTASNLTPFYSKYILSEVKEPILYTPKGISIEAFEVKEKTLMIINLHLINFRKIWAFKKQLTSISHILDKHKGPLILAGDFNTWNKYRKSFLNKFANSKNLKEAPLKRLNNFLKLDHFYFRGFKLIKAKQLDVQTSDHFPILVELKLLKE